MYLEITQHGDQARNLGYLLVKHPDRAMQKEVNGGVVHVFFPRADDEVCTAAVLLDSQPILSIKGDKFPALTEYVSANGYVNGSHFMTAMNAVLNSAIAGKCRDKPELAEMDFDFEFRMPAVLSTGGAGLLRDLFVPLGYDVKAEELRHCHDFLPEEGKVVDLRVRRRAKLSECLRQVGILTVVAANNRYFMPTQNDVDMLSTRGEGWLADHPLKSFIVNRFLEKRRSLVNDAIEAIGESSEEKEKQEQEHAEDQEKIEDAVAKQPSMRLHPMRMRICTKIAELYCAKRVIDFGCGEGQLTRRLLSVSGIEAIEACDISSVAIDKAARRCRLSHLTHGQDRLRFRRASFSDYHPWMAGQDVAFMVEVIEHLEEHHLRATVDNVFGNARPFIVVVTTPERDFNVNFVGMSGFRHRDHRFEFTREEFNEWVDGIRMYGYTPFKFGLGPEVDGSRPTQGCMFVRGGGNQHVLALSGAISDLGEEVDCCVR